MAEDHQHLDGSGNLAAFLHVLRRRAWLVLLCTLAVPAMAFAWTQRQDEKYEAHAKVLLEPAGFEQSLASPVDGPDATGEAAGDSLATDVGVAALETIAARTESSLAARGTPTTVKGKVEASSDGEANVIQITATGTDPALAATISNAYAAQFVSFRRAAARRRIRAARRTLRARLAVEGRRRRAQITALTRQRRRALSRLGAMGLEARSGSRAQILDDRAGELRDRIAELRQRDDQQRERVASLVTLERLQTGNARVVDPAEAPTEPSSPEPVRNIVAGISLGLLLGALLAVLFEAIDRRIRNPEEISELYEAPLLGAVPHSAALADVRSGALRPPTLDREAFRMVQASMSHFSTPHEIRSVLVTSAAPEEGKTTVAWHVAQASAEVGKRVLLIEADLRHPAIAERLHATGRVGLSDVLRGHTAFHSAVCQVPIAEARGPVGAMNGHGPNGANGNGPAEHWQPPTMDVLFAGRAMSDPRSLLASENMADLIRQTEDEYDLVVIDSPPATVVSDAVPLVGQVSGIIVVTRLGRDTRGASKILHHQLQNLDATVLGVVVNAVEADDGAYGAVYDYTREYAGA